MRYKTKLHGEVRFTHRGNQFANTSFVFAFEVRYILAGSMKIRFESAIHREEQAYGNNRCIHLIHLKGRFRVAWRQSAEAQQCGLTADLAANLGGQTAQADFAGQSGFAGGLQHPRAKSAIP